jgi:hypothetical protein
VDPRTLIRVAAGDCITGMAAQRARRVLEQAGYPVPKGKVA